jgi:hypothetical protein
MDISFQSILLFIITTVIYFVFAKPKLTCADLNDMTQYTHNTGIRAGLYVLVVVLLQFALNMAYMSSKCTGSNGYMSAVAMYTFLPWFFIFGILVLVLMIYPGFKSSFADVIGYFVVSGSANKLFGDILLAPADVGENRETAQSIMKLCSNKSIIVNQINPGNFNDMWNMLTPLMRPEVDEDVKQKMLDMVCLKDNIGEAMWYVYAALLLSSIVYYKLATSGCNKSVQQLKKEHDSYVQDMESQKAKEEQINAVGGSQYMLN